MCTHTDRQPCVHKNIHADINTYLHTYVHTYIPMPRSLIWAWWAFATRELARILLCGIYKSEAPKDGACVTLAILPLGRGGQGGPVHVLLQATALLETAERDLRQKLFGWGPAL